VVTRAGVSRAVFREVFDSDEQCFSDAFDDSLARLSHVVESAVARQAGWLERVRGGLVALLGFFDDEPYRAQLLVMDAPVDAATGLKCRERLHHVLAALIDADHGANLVSPAGLNRENGSGVGARAGMSPALTAELLVGGVFSVIRTSLLEQDRGKLVELAPSLMAFIVAPYLGPAAARVELAGIPPTPADAIADDADSGQVQGSPRAAMIARTAALPIRVTHRTTLVLRAVARVPYSNNREIAQAAEITDEGQASKLLARLEQRGVIENVGVGPARGEPNAWLLTASGRRVVEVIGQDLGAAPRRRGARVRGAG
jgi:hypothetical protein